MGLLNSQISVSFQHPEFGYVVDIEDDSDVMKLKQVMFEETKQPVHLYVSVIGEFPKEQVVVKNPASGRGSKNRCSGSKNRKSSSVSETIVAEVTEGRSGVFSDQILPISEVEEQHVIGNYEHTLGDNGNPKEGWSDDEFTHTIKQVTTRFMVCLKFLQVPLRF